MMRSRLLFLLIAGLAGAGAGWLFTEMVLSEDPLPALDTTPTAGELLGTTRPDFSLGSTTGDVLTAGDFDGQVLLINFWATWCAPCREEMPMLSGLHERLAGQGFQVVGIALDDVQQARDFVEEMGIGYPIMVGSTDVMATGRSYGNRAGLLPYSVLVDRQGIIRWTSLGELELSELDARIEELL
jgi:thiol-disulfide isomerase/thioredoxin